MQPQPPIPASFDTPILRMKRAAALTLTELLLLALLPVCGMLTIITKVTERHHALKRTFHGDLPRNNQERTPIV